MNKIHTTKILIATLVISLGLVTTSSNSAFAGSASENNAAGYRDGCADAQSGTSAAYNGHSNASHHSDSYNVGYSNGYSACQVQQTVAVSNQNSNNVDQNNREQPQTQNAANTNHCFVLIGTCGAPGINQGQSLNN